MTIIVYHWTCGAYINSYDEELFEKYYSELYHQYGPPAIALVENRD